MGMVIVLVWPPALELTIPGATMLLRLQRRRQQQQQPQPECYMGLETMGDLVAVVAEVDGEAAAMEACWRVDWEDLPQGCHVVVVHFP